jgi:glutathione S-transferase
MYTLHYSPGSCSLVIHCLLEELGTPFELSKVDLAAGGHHAEGYRKLNPKGKVPTLVTPDGALTECIAVIEHLCDRHDAEGRLMGRPGSWRRAKTLERMATLATEVHADDFSDAPAVQAAVKARGAEKVLAWFRAEDERLTGAYWSGDEMSAADLYFMVVARWGRRLEPSVLGFANIDPFFRRMCARPAVARAMASETITPYGT